MKKLLHFIIITLSFLFSAELILHSEETKDHAIIIKTSVDSVPTPRIIFKWDKDTSTVDFPIEYSIWRKSKSAAAWGNEYAILDASAEGFIDSSISIGTGYEYKFKRKTIYFDAFTYIYAGINLPSQNYRGKALLLVDETMARLLKDELERYKLDLIGDGWQVLRIDVPRTEQFNGAAVKYIKKIILDEYKLYKDTLKSIILFGRIAVPYSGDFAMDDHVPDHYGAWAADLYYGNIDGNWSDSLIYDVRATRPDNKNMWGDGKFDNSIIPTDITIAVGRVDFYNLPEFTKTELYSLRNYLNKDHDYRNKIYSPRPYALIDDGFGMNYNEAFGSNAWMDFTALVPPENIVAGGYRYGQRDSSYLWSYGCNSGGYNTVMFIAYTFDFDTIPYNSVFTILFGSYLGDFDSQNNIMRTALASSPSILTCCWSGRPFWYFHHMSLGETIGYSTVLSQNNMMLYESSGKYGYRYTHTALMGDPTLRLHTVAPPSNAQVIYSTVSEGKNEAKIVWNASPDGILGYNIYRANTIDGMFEKINAEPVADISYVDSTAIAGKAVYMIRAMKLEQAATGTYFNQSEGIFASTDIPRFDFSLRTQPDFSYYPNPAGNNITISILQPITTNFKITIYDLTGRLIKVLASGIQSPNLYKYQYIWNLTDVKGAKVPVGVYLLKYTTNEFVKTAMLMVY